MKHPHPGETGAVRELGNPFGKTEIIKSSAAPQESRVVQFPGARPERSHDARDLSRQLVRQIFADQSREVLVMASEGRDDVLTRAALAALRILVDGDAA